MSEQKINFHNQEIQNHVVQHNIKNPNGRYNTNGPISQEINKIQRNRSIDKLGFLDHKNHINNPYRNKS